ncbi:MAG: prepilin-type N-terminal cleavage/methylation domain-containing protein, partial [Acidobacteria bacterium]|nr:prepilin-type N-terminal cleavage/methylation domain-containing protein [Acidobacteriota bacterium]
MSTRATSQAAAADAGFSLVEVLVSMGIMLLVLSGTLSIMSSAMKSQQTMKDVLDMNSHLRASMDLIQRDLLQVGQGLPVGRRVGVPNGDGAVAINRPGPGDVDGCGGVTTFGTDPTIPAVSVGPGIGPPINDECTDVITILAADNVFGSTDNLAGEVPVWAISADGTTATLSDVVDIADDPDVDGDNLRPGDLLMLVKGINSVLMQVTAVAGQTVTFGTGADDPLGLNQFDAGLDVLGTINQLKDQAPADNDEPDDTDNNGVTDSFTRAVRIRMVTYFVDVTTNPMNPRLVRIVNGGQANAVGLGVQAFR